MFLSNLSIKRPVFATVLMLALVTLGIFSYRRLAVDMFPDIEFPVLSIVTALPGRLAGDRRARGHEAHRGGGQPDRRRQARLLVVARGRLLGDRRVRARGQGQRRGPGRARQDLRHPQRAPRGDRGADHPEDRHRRDGRSSRWPSAPTTLTPRELTTLVDRRVKRRLENVPGVGKVELVGDDQARGAASTSTRPGSRPSAWGWTRWSPASPARTSTRRSAGSTGAAQELPVRDLGQARATSPDFGSMVIASQRAGVRHHARRGGRRSRTASRSSARSRSSTACRRSPSTSSSSPRRTRSGVVDAVNARDREAPTELPRRHRDPDRARRLDHDPRVGRTTSGTR